MKEFGRQAYEDVVYINFHSNTRMAELVAADLDKERFAELLDKRDFQMIAIVTCSITNQ